MDTHPDMIAPTIFMRSNLRVASFLLPMSLNIPMIERQEAAPTADMIVFMMVRAGWLVSLSWVMFPELPALNMSQSTKRMKHPPTTRGREAGWKPRAMCSS